MDGRRRYRSARRLLICADSGGSNSSRTRAWKVNLQELADEIGIAITVCHYPPGISKWNRVEHRLFSFISLTWKGQPLWNHEAVINLIGATKTNVVCGSKLCWTPTNMKPAFQSRTSRWRNSASVATRLIQPGTTH